MPMVDAKCDSCLECGKVCPVGALIERLGAA
jgi:predicted molibdopterin-dependent oxidoreductase YjgC